MREIKIWDINLENFYFLGDELFWFVIWLVFLVDGWSINGFMVVGGFVITSGNRDIAFPGLIILEANDLLAERVDVNEWYFSIVLILMFILSLMLKYEII